MWRRQWRTQGLGQNNPCEIDREPSDVTAPAPPERGPSTPAGLPNGSQNSDKGTGMPPSLVNYGPF
jgi:hypothetical protein